MGFIPGDRCSLKTTGLWICFLMTYLYGTGQAASADNCSMTFTAGEGEITSPGYPGNYIGNLNCTYVIVGDLQNRLITIDLVELALETHTSCRIDWLIIDGGPRLCFPKPFHKIYAFRDRFVINFSSDRRSSERGFKIRYSIDANDTCTSTHLRTSGQISTPCFSCSCPNNTCTNTIIGNGKLQILILDFVSLNFTTSANCDLGWFTIDGGPRKCTSTPFKTTYDFFGSVDIVTYGGDRSVGSCAGFVVNYVVQDDCSTTFTASVGEITSPGYPRHYINNLYCTFVVVGDGRTQMITISLVDLDLKSIYYCKSDWLIFNNGPKLCSDSTFHKTYVFRDRFVINFRSNEHNTARGFKLLYSLDSHAHDNCSSTHLKTSGQISTPCYSCNCTHNNCTNIIIGNERLQLLILDFVSLNFPTSANCHLGWLTIDGGPRICPSTPFKATYALYGSVDIVTHGGGQSADSCGGFVVNYVVQENCSMTFTASEGEITSPGYPGTTISYFYCTYVIMGNGQNRSIAIDLVELDLEATTNCSNDWLVIDDGLKLCYHTTFRKTYVLRDRFIIKFRTDYRRPRYGFKMHYSIGVDAHDNCTSIHLKTSGQISTPCYSCNCAYNNCTNTIIGSGKLQTLTLDFVALNYTTSPNCDLGWFTIDGGPKICTSTPFQTIYAFFGSVDIVTHGGDRSLDSCAGFVVNYVVQENCSMTFTANEGEITSPGYPGTPINYLYCTYVIMGDGQNRSIAIDMVKLDLFDTSSCHFDWIVIDDGLKLCYHTTFHKTYVLRDRLTIKFRTEYRWPSYGFKMHYSIGLDAQASCTSILLQTSGQISTPCYSCNCTYNNYTNTIIGSGKKLQSLTLDFVSVNYTTSANCDLGWFTIDGGPKLCTSTPFQTIYAFFGSVDIVTHGGDGPGTSCAGFVVNYVVQDTCSITLTASEGEITSPGYPGIPFNDLTCTYVIVGDGQNQSITIDVVDLDLFFFSDCFISWLIINDGPKLCHNTQFHKTYVFRDRFIIKFRSDYLHHSRGFKLHYSVGGDAHENCSMTLTASEGEITSPGYPGTRTNYFYCTYAIMGNGQNQSIAIDLIKLDLEATSDCSNDWLVIDDGLKLCYHTTFRKTYVFQDRFIIKFRTQFRRPSRGFKMHYSVGVDAHDNCSSIHLETSGHISTPCLSCNCTYNNCTNTIIGSGKLQTLILDFVALNYTTSANCDLGWLTIDGGPKICTSNPFQTIYAFFGSVDIVTHGGDRSVGSCGGYVVNYVVEDVDNNLLTYTTNSGQLIGPLFPGAGSSNPVTYTYIIIGHFSRQRLILDITLRSSYGGCYFAKLTLNGTEDLYDAGRYSRTYLSENNFTLDFTPNYDASFLVHYEKEDIIKGSS